MEAHQNKLPSEEKDFAFIYGLFDPVTNEIKYVGKTISPFKRLMAHYSAALQRKKIFYTTNWIYSLLISNKKPIMKILEKIKDTRSIWKAKENYWINCYKKLGFKLTNSIEGGCGGSMKGRPGYKKSEELKLRMSLARKGKPNYKSRGRKVTGQALENLRKGFKKRGSWGTHSQETRQNMSQNRRNKNYKRIRKAIHKIDTNNNIIKTYLSIAEAIKDNNTSCSHIHRHLNKTIKKIKTHTYIYA